MFVATLFLSQETGAIEMAMEMVYKILGSSMAMEMAMVCSLLRLDCDESFVVMLE